MGQGIRTGLEVFVGSDPCLYVTVLSLTQATCQLQAGTGPRNPVALRLCLTGGASRCLQESDPAVLSATNYPFVHFAAPQITKLMHPAVSMQSVHTTDCLSLPRLVYIVPEKCARDRPG